jgi:hypothetical protein
MSYCYVCGHSEEDHDPVLGCTYDVCSCIYFEPAPDINEDGGQDGR